MMDYNPNNCSIYSNDQLPIGIYRADINWQPYETSFAPSDGFRIESVGRLEIALEGDERMINMLKEVAELQYDFNWRLKDVLELARILRALGMTLEQVISSLRVGIPIQGKKQTAHSGLSDSPRAITFEGESA